MYENPHSTTWFHGLHPVTWLHQYDVTVWPNLGQWYGETLQGKVHNIKDTSCARLGWRTSATRTQRQRLY